MFLFFFLNCFCAFAACSWCWDQVVCCKESGQANAMSRCPLSTQRQSQNSHRYAPSNDTHTFTRVCVSERGFSSAMCCSSSWGSGRISVSSRGSLFDCQVITSRGGRFLEAPVAGSQQLSNDGMLVILAAGDRTVYEDCSSCFQAMGKTSFFLGMSGEVGWGGVGPLDTHITFKKDKQLGQSLRSGPKRSIFLHFGFCDD